MIVAFVGHDVECFEIFIGCSSAVVFEGRFSVVSGEGWVWKNSGKDLELFEFLLSFFDGFIVQLGLLDCGIEGLFSFGDVGGFCSWGFEVDGLIWIEVMLDGFFEEMGFLKYFSFVIVNHNFRNGVEFVLNRIGLWRRLMLLVDLFMQNEWFGIWYKLWWNIGCWDKILLMRVRNGFGLGLDEGGLGKVVVRGPREDLEHGGLCGAGFWGKTAARDGIAWHKNKIQLKLM